MHELRERLVKSKPSQKTLAKLQLLQDALEKDRRLVQSNRGYDKPTI